MGPKVICRLLMITVAPFTVSTTLFCMEPSRWGGSNPLTILVMSVFGLMSVPLWPTFIPALVFTPVVMEQFARKLWFSRVHPAILVFGFAVAGGLAGVLVLLPVIVLSLDTKGLAVHWATAGFLAGGITLAAVAIIYRRATSKDMTGATPHLPQS